MTDIENILISIFSIASCILVAHLVCKYKVYHYSGDNTRFGCIDGLRGYLALGVFIHHFVITFAWKTTGAWVSPAEGYFNNFGNAGVAVFFMITGFLFVRKILDSGESINWTKIFISRIFRIFPLYIACLLVIILFVAIQSNFVNYSSASQLLIDVSRWLLYTGSSINGYADTGKIIASVDWTLKYEWFFYLTLPLLALLMKSKIATLLACLIVVAGAISPYQIGLLVWNFMWQLSSFFLIFFLIGGLTARLSKLTIGEYIDHPFVTLLALCCLAGLFWGFDTSFGFYQSLLLAGFFIPVALGNSLFGLLNRRFSKFLGEISYSIYLTHGIVLFTLFTLLFPGFLVSISVTTYMLLMPLVAAIVVLLSWFTFSTIEKPMMMLGKKIANKQ